MGLLLRLAEIMHECREQYDDLENFKLTDYKSLEQIGDGENHLVRGDNLHYMNYLLRSDNKKESLQFIYVDPPFFSKADYKNSIELFDGKAEKIMRLKQKSYQDTWENGMEEYLKMLTIRFLCMKELLTPTGCLWVHLDWHAAHYVKIILDEIFGVENFVNEVIWCYKSGGVSKKRFARKHDTLLFYSKTKDYFFSPRQEKSYNRGLKPYRFKGVAEYEDEKGWYTLVNMKDVWFIDMVGRTSAERTGYATQKPEALLERILLSCTKEDDLCADFFAGSGTLAAVAHRLERRWISCDNGALAISNAYARLAKKNANCNVLIERDLDGETRSSATLVFEIDRPQQEATGRFRLVSFEPSAAIRKKAAELFGKEMEGQLHADPLALISYWGVDLHYDGEIFRAEQNFFREKGKLTTVYEKTVATDGSAAVRIVDLFGHYAIYVIEKRSEE